LTKKWLFGSRHNTIRYTKEINMNEKAIIAFQFAVLLILSVAMGYILVTQGELNEFIAGAIVGVFVGLPLSKKE